MKIDNKKRDKLIKNFLERNEKINVSWIRDYKWVKSKHIKDSLELNKILNIKTNSQVADLWSWGGFPLLALAISNPQAKFTWLESKRKKTKVINSLIEKCNITNAKSIWTRWENHNQKYEILTARAVAYIDELLKYSYQLVKKWGKFVFYKSDSKQEHQDLIKQTKKYNLKVSKIHKYKLFENDITRVIYILDKT